MIIFNEGQEGRTDVLGADTRTSLPVVFASFAVGNELAEGGNSQVSLSTNTLTTVTTSRNLLAETKTGDAETVVMVGSHLDSVEEGAGINGSGSATILEMALQLNQLGAAPLNKVRFAWWSAEESGLIGSTQYVNDLTQQQADDIEVYVNFDMIGSPNFARFVFGPEGSPAGSEIVTNTFVDYLTSKGFAHEFDFAGSRSDHAAFRAIGIPIGGLFTGAEVVKTEEQVKMYGGEAGIAFDRCYHSACDDINNINPDALESMSKAAAHTLSVLAQRSEPMRQRTAGLRSLAATQRVDLSNEERLGKKYQR